MTKQYVLWATAIALIAAAAELGRRCMAEAKRRQDIKARSLREASAEKDRQRHELLTERISRFVAALDVIHADLRWRGSAMKIVGWGSRYTTHGETEQSILCRTEFDHWAILNVRADEKTVRICSIEKVPQARARQFMEPYPDEYTKLFEEPLPA